MKINGGHAILESLIHEGVDTIFGYPGGQVIPLYDSLYDYRHKINHILVRHEQGAAHAAEGYAWTTGKPGVCFVTSGPGATNLTTGIANAMMDSVPLVCITGQVGSTLVGTDAFQEVDFIGITTPITKWNYQITQAQEIPEIIAKAFYIARSGRPGPVVIDLTRNSQVEVINYVKTKCHKIESYKPNYFPNKKQVELAAEALNKAKRPFIFAGHGVLISKAGENVQKLSEKANIPIATTLLGISAIPSSYHLNFGMLGMHGHYCNNILTNKADVILAVGMRFDDRVTGQLSTYAKNATIIHIDIDPAEVNKNVKADIPIVADAKHAIEALITQVYENKHDSWINEFKKLCQVEEEKVIKKEIFPKAGKIRMGEVMRMLTEKTKGQAVVVADVGQHQMMAARYYEPQYPNHFITSGGLGTMGYGVPAGIGAKIGQPEKEVVVVVGDGSIQMNIQEFGTIAQEKIPLKIILLKNNYLGMVRQWQQLFFQKRYSFTQLLCPDFMQIAKAYKIDSESVDKRESLNAALNRLLKSKKPYLLEVNVEDEQNVLPMVPAGASIEDMILE